MAASFKKMIETIVHSYIDDYAIDSVMARMLKIIYLSPFCLGRWDRIVIANERGRVTWHI